MAERTPAVPRKLEVLHATTGPGQPSGGAQACCGPWETQDLLSTVRAGSTPLAGEDTGNCLG